MSTIHLHETTTSTPEQFVAGLTDFGPGRSKLFGNSADEYLKVHHRGSHDADVTEGSSGNWERLHYDWSDPNRIVMTTTDSNLWGGGSGHTYTFTRRPDGKTDVDAVARRAHELARVEVANRHLFCSCGLVGNHRDRLCLRDRTACGTRPSSIV